MHRMAKKTYPLEVNEELWSQYRKTVTQEKNLDEPIIDFIEDRVEKLEQTTDSE